jgi:hypothetical protein
MMISVNNFLFDFAKIKCELEFINKSKYLERYEYVKNLIKSNLSEIAFSFPIENDTDEISFQKKTKYFFNFFEISDMRNVSDSSLK